MMHDIQFAIGDICGDPTGLRVKVEDVDITITFTFRSLKTVTKSTKRMRGSRERCPMWLSFIASRSWAIRLPTGWPPR